MHGEILNLARIILTKIKLLILGITAAHPDSPICFIFMQCYIYSFGNSNFPGLGIYKRKNENTQERKHARVHANTHENTQTRTKTRTRTRKRPRKKELGQENTQANTSACLRGRVRVFLFSYFLFFFYKFPALDCMP